MRIKSFFCESVEQALSMAQSELGPEALLLNSREAPPEGRHLGKFEVVFGLETGQAVAAVSPPGAPDGASDTNLARLSKDIAELRKEMQHIRGLGEVPVTTSQETLPVLLGAGIERWLAEDIELSLPGRRPKSPDSAGPRFGRRPPMVQPMCPSLSANHTMP